MEQNPGEANSSSSQETPCILRNPDVLYRVHYGLYLFLFSTISIQSMPSPKISLRQF